MGVAPARERFDVVEQRPAAARLHQAELVRLGERGPLVALQEEVLGRRDRVPQPVVVEGRRRVDRDDRRLVATVVEHLVHLIALATERVVQDEEIPAPASRP